MEVSQIFDWANSIALFTWALIIFTPRWQYTQFLINRLVVPFLLGSVYLILIAGNFTFSTFDFGSLDDIRKLFENDYLLLAGWVHYLAFDLVVGSWILQHAQKNLISHRWLILPLFFTFALGPVGFVFYMIISSIKTKRSPFLYQIEES